MNCPYGTCPRQGDAMNNIVPPGYKQTGVGEFPRSRGSQDWSFDKTRLLKQRVMQELLTGRIQLVSDKEISHG